MLTYVEQADSSGDVVLVVLDWLLARLADCFEGCDVNDTPDGVTLLLVPLKDGLNIGSILEVTWEDLDDSVFTILLGGAGWEFVEGNLRDAGQGGGVGVAEAGCTR